MNRSRMIPVDDQDLVDPAADAVRLERASGLERVSVFVHPWQALVDVRDAHRVGVSTIARMTRSQSISSDRPRRRGSRN
jgi:hypothetical protein